MRLAAVCAFLAAFAAAGWVLAPSPPAEPRPPASPQPPTRAYRFAVVDRSGSPFFTDRELVWYEWKTHTFALGPAVTPAEMWRRCEGGVMSGVPFSVVADGVTCYRGAFFTDQSSNRKPGPTVIYLHPGDRQGVLNIELSYSTPEEVKAQDPRNDERVRAVLRAVGKLRE